MRDLRRQALLESGKTISRKARSKQVTPDTSRANSAAPSPRSSRIPSREGSDDDDDELSDTTQWSSNSIDGMLSPDADIDEAPDAWIANLGDRIGEICDRKRSSAQGREESLQAFNTALIRHYAQEELRFKIDTLLPAILKSVKSGQTEREVVLALKALALLLITEPSDKLYDALSAPIKTVIQDAQHPTAKLAAIHTLGVATFYGGASIEETEATMEFFLEIVSSDGAILEEADNATIVTAALEEWGFLATQVEDMEGSTETAMDTFVEQLESSDAGVQIAAGDNIALLFEKSYTEAESDDEIDEADPDHEASGNGHGPTMIRRYTVYRQRHLLEQTLEQLAKASSKRLSKRDRKQLHLAFADIRNTVEKPMRGPRYSTALDDEGREMGSRLKIAVHGGGRMTINKWWQLHRLNGLKRLLQGGLMVHFELNEVVYDSLSVPSTRDE